jgi:hypothetical protein
MPSPTQPFSRILSYILHPLLIPVLASSALMLRPDLYTIVLPTPLKLWFIGIVGIFTVIVPATSVFLLMKLNMIDSIELNRRTERTIPLLISSISFMALLYILMTSGMPPVFLYMLYSATFALLAGLLINMVYKISLHTLGWAAMAASLTSISLRMGVPMLMLITGAWIISGVVGYARLKQNAHNQTQVYLGYVAGVSIIVLITLLS